MSDHGGGSVGIAAAPFAFGLLMDWLGWPSPLLLWGASLQPWRSLGWLLPPPVVARTRCTDSNFADAADRHRSPGGTCWPIEGFYS